MAISVELSGANDDILGHIDHLPAWWVLRGKGGTRVVQYIDKVLSLDVIIAKHVDFVSERTG